MKLSGHHAHLLRHEWSTIPELVRDLEVDSEEAIFCSMYETVGLTEVASLKEMAARRPVVGKSQLLVVAARKISFEAQQALLKLLEEPPKETNFLFILEPQAVVLPTLQSRFFEIATVAPAVPVSQAYLDFVAHSYADRLELITAQLAKKDQQWLTYMKVGAGREAQKLVTEAREGRATTQALSALAFITEHLGERGASNKQLLELLALTVPVGRA